MTFASYIISMPLSMRDQFHVFILNIEQQPEIEERLYAYASSIKWKRMQPLAAAASCDLLSNLPACLLAHSKY